MFETFAVLSTLSCVVIFVVLYRIDRAGRLEEAAREAAPPDDASQTRGIQAPKR
jgi:hypothetical protein